MDWLKLVDLKPNRDWLVERNEAVYWFIVDFGNMLCFLLSSFFCSSCKCSCVPDCTIVGCTYLGQLWLTTSWESFWLLLVFKATFWGHSHNANSDERRIGAGSFLELRHRLNHRCRTRSWKALGMFALFWFKMRCYVGCRTAAGKSSLKHPTSWRLWK